MRRKRCGWRQHAAACDATDGSNHGDRLSKSASFSAAVPFGSFRFRNFASSHFYRGTDVPPGPNIM